MSDQTAQRYSHNHVVKNDTRIAQFGFTLKCGWTIPKWQYMQEIPQKSRHYCVIALSQFLQIAGQLCKTSTGGVRYFSKTFLEAHFFVVLYKVIIVINNHCYKNTQMLSIKDDNFWIYNTARVVFSGATV